MISLIDFAAWAGNPGLLAALAALGFVIGGLTGLFGVGGAFLVTPLLIVLFRIDESLAIGSGLCAVIGTSAAGLSRHWRLRSVELKTMLMLAAGTIPGAFLGAMLHQYLRWALGEAGSLGFPVIVRSLFLVLLPTAGYLAYRGPTRHSSGLTILQRLPLPPRVSLGGAGLTGVSLPGVCILGLGVGVITGLLGVGGGVLYMPVLVAFVGLSAHQAVGTSLGVVLLGAIVGTVRYATFPTAGFQMARYAPVGNVSLGIAMLLLVGGTIGVQLGVWICHRLHATRLRRYFVVIVLLTAVLVAADLINKITAG
jgi:uncharacterized membrane protein YfcA